MFKKETLITIALAGLVFVGVNMLAHITLSLVRVDWLDSDEIAAQNDLIAPRPPWANPDGSLNRSKLPERYPVAGSSGEIVGYVDSQELFKEDLQGPFPGESADDFESRRMRENDIAVYDESGERIGHMVYESGASAISRFLPLDSIPEEIATPASTH